MAEGLIQLWDILAQPAQHLHVFQGIFHLYLHHIVDKMLVGGSLRPAEQQVDRLPVLADVVHHPVHIITGGFAHVRRLLLLRQLGKACLGFHEPAHQGGGVGLY